MDNIKGSEWLLLVVLFIHLIMAPFSKVEESFNIQAIHDFLYHRTNYTQYDHIEFPGVVPRTFFGSILISAIVMPFLPFFQLLNAEKYWMLFVSRFVIGFGTILTFCNFSRCVEKKFTPLTGTFLRLITASQFHFLFYASRTLPNTYAMILVLWAYQKWLDRKMNFTTILATLSTILFRFELIMLFGPIYLICFLRRQYSIIKFIFIGIITAIITLAITIPIDSFFWKRWVWPEGEVLWFNTILNRSNEYGISPFMWYFTSVLPRALSFTLFFIPLGFLSNRRTLTPIIAPAFSFIVIYSFLPHKELRFISYSFPLINICGAVFCAKLWSLRNVSILRKCLAYTTIFHLFINLMMTSVFLYASARNYPGGDALIHLQFIHRYLKNKPITVYIDPFCAGSGINKFLHLYPNWEYNKTENLTFNDYQRFDYILLGSNKANFREFIKQKFFKTHKEHFVVETFHNIFFKTKNFFPFFLPTIRFKKKVIVLKKIDKSQNL